MAPHILLIEDLSCVGRAALTVSLPVLCAAGVRVTPLPTALFSSHTGGLGEVHRRDLTEDMDATLTRWAQLPLQFDAIHVGYLAGAHQLPVVERALSLFRGPNTQLYVDPVMGDWGKRYGFLTDELEAGFARLCAQADVIFPNRTETAMLLEQPYEKQAPIPEKLLNQLRGLMQLGAKAAVITGITQGDGHVGAVFMDGPDAMPRTAFSPMLPGSWPGTGDLFAAAVQGAVLRGKPLSAACDVGVRFVYQCLKDADPAPQQTRFGAPFEQALPWYIAALDA